MEENKDVEKKSHTGAKVFLVLLLMIGCLVLGYYLSNSGIVNIDLGKSDKKEVSDKSKKTTKSDSKECEEALEVSSNEAIDLFSKMTSAEGYYCGFFKMFTDKKVTVDSIDPKDVSKIVLRSLYRKYNRTDEGSTYTKDEVDAMVKEIFGKDYKYTHGTIEGACPAFTYDEASQTYKVGVHACGGTCGPSSLAQVVKAVKTSNGIDLYVRMIFAEDQSIIMTKQNISDVNYYSDFARTNKLDLVRDQYGRVAETLANYAKGSLYKMTFELEDGNYIFKSSESVTG